MCQKNKWYDEWNMKNTLIVNVANWFVIVISVTMKIIVVRWAN